MKSFCLRIMIYKHIIVICLTRLCFAIPSEYIRTAKDELPPNDRESSILMLKEANRLCQTANLCRSNSTGADNTLELQRNTASCCQDCTCDESCGNRGDCCFPTAEDKDLENVRREYQKCTTPTTREFPPTENYKHKFYYMTAMCPAGKGVPDFNGQEDCGNIRVAPWGSLHPIYSSSTGRIYKNRACADCHEVHDGVLSMAFMACKFSGKTTVADYFYWLNRNSVSKYCHVQFRFQQSIEAERCLLDVIGTCNGSEIEIPDWSEMTSRQIIDACHNGIAAPFQYLKAYSNVFCYLCNGGGYTEQCFKMNTDQYAPASSVTFLLDGDTLKTGIRLDTDVKRRPPVACMPLDEQNPDACVSVYCPTGQIYHKKFQCAHVAPVWQIPYFHVALRLKVVPARLKISTLIAEIRQKDVSSWILSPWPHWWTVNSIHYVTGSDDNTTSIVESFLVIIKTRPDKKHNSVLRQIRRYLKEDWTLNLTTSSIALSADFLEYTFRATATAGRMLYLPLWYIRGLKKPQTYGIDQVKENSIRIIFWKEVDIKEKLRPTGRITRMYFCKQVSLGFNFSDYELLADNLLLYYNRKVYYDGEFELVSREDGSFEPRICLLDSPYTEMPMERSGSAPVAAVIVSFPPFVLLFVRYGSFVVKFM